MKRRAFCDKVVFHSVLVLNCWFEARNEKLWEIINDLVKVINRGCEDPGDRWLLASNLCRDCCKVIHVYEAVPGHVNGQVVDNEKICSRMGSVTSAMWTSWMKERPWPERRETFLLPHVLMWEPLAAMRGSLGGQDFLSMGRLEQQRTQLHSQQGKCSLSIGPWLSSCSFLCGLS